MNHPEVVDRLAILNAAHPRRLQEGLHHPDQLRKSCTSSSLRYQDCPRTWCTPETGTSSDTFCKTRPRPTRRRRLNATSRRGRSQGQPLDDQLLPRLCQTVPEGSRSKASPDFSADTGHLGGARFLPRLRTRRAQPRNVPNLDRVERLLDASHWVHHDASERVNQLLIDFFA